MLTLRLIQSKYLPSLLKLSAHLTLKISLLTGTVLATGCLDHPVGESTPTTTNVVVQKQANNAITGIDLLLMIDNSSSMADKQTTLAAAVPRLLGQLVQPNCVDASGNSLNPPVPATLGVGCPTGSAPEFNPVNNIHVGIVTSSLGDHGANSLCSPGAPTNYTDDKGQPVLQPPDVNDMGHLVGTLARAQTAPTNVLADPQSQYATIPTDPSPGNPYGFLAWGNSDLPTDVGQQDLTDASKIFMDMVIATNEYGCGFESQLEGWFRFLIDPVPPVYPLASPDPNTHQTRRVGSDDTLLLQRAAFLRPDSLVAIVMLTDENDCSVRDTDVGWVSASSGSISTGSTQCASNPDDKCCYSCTAVSASGVAPGGCPNTCTKDPTTGTWPAGVDDGTNQANVRCWNQKRRFGIEFMYPKSRYVVGLTNKMLCPDQDFGDMDCDCTVAHSIGASCNPGSRQLPNPLYSTTVGTMNNNSPLQGYPQSIPRSDNSAIFLAGIIGVPWQDIGYLDPTSGNLVYIPVTDPAWTSGAGGNQPINVGSTGIWDMIYGDDNANIFPHDMHMIESLVPRVAGGNVDGKAGSADVIPNTLPWSAQSIPAPAPGPIATTNANPNGGEYNTALEDLEYACIFPLVTPRACACNTVASTALANCKYLNPNDCCDQTFQADGAGTAVGVPNFDKPLCNGTTQVAAKGYPGLREIAVLHDYANSSAATTQGNSIVASICPNDLTSTSSNPGYGYNPAVAALISRLKEKLKGSCLPRPLQVTINADGSVSLPCSVVEVVPGSNLKKQDCASYCTAEQRGVPSPQMTAAVLDSMRTSKICDVPGNPPCSTMCLCQLNQESATPPNATSDGTNLYTCQNVDNGDQDKLPAGYCYVDPQNGVGTNPDIVAKCPETERRILRFVGNDPSGGGVAVPLPNAIVFTACQGSAISAAVAASAPVGDAGP